jgi:hypothetical protein
LDITVLKDGGLVNHKFGQPMALPNQVNQATQVSTGISNGSAYIKPKATPAADFNASRRNVDLRLSTPAMPA